MSRELACCINPQPGGPGDFWSRFSSSSPWYASIKLQGSSASFGPPRVFYFPGTRHIWWAFSYPPPGEAPDRRLATTANYWLKCTRRLTIWSKHKHTSHKTLMCQRAAVRLSKKATALLRMPEVLGSIPGPEIKTLDRFFVLFVNNALQLLGW